MTQDTFVRDAAKLLGEGDTFAPNKLATALFGDEGAFQGGKRVRAYLRATYPRNAEQKNTTWTLSRDVAIATVAAFLAKRVTSNVTTEATPES